MRRCLSERALARLYAEGGTVNQRVHLDTCPTCRHRYLEITQDLEVVSRVLRRTSEPELGHARRGRVWLPTLAGAGIAAAVAVAIWIPSSRAPISPPQRSVTRSDERDVVVSKTPRLSAGHFQSDDTAIAGQLQELEAAVMFEAWCDALDIEGTPRCEAWGQGQWTDGWESDPGV